MRSSYLVYASDLPAGAKKDDAGAYSRDIGSAWNFLRR